VALRSRVEEIMRQELASRAADRMGKAGDTWKKQVLGFFFPKNEDTVDLCALAVLDRALAEDGTTVPPPVRKDVRDLIATSTKVKDAVSMIFLATAQPIEVEP
jgi:hypothetical protein